MRAWIDALVSAAQVRGARVLVDGVPALSIVRTNGQLQQLRSSITAPPSSLAFAASVLLAASPRGISSLPRKALG
jgi:hypothetical protein